MNNTELFNDLSEYVTLRILSCNSMAHKAGWVERKSHHDYDLWLVQQGQITIRTGDVDHIATAGDLIFFYPHISYMATNGEEGCKFIYVHFDFGLGNQHRILDSFPLSGVVPSQLVQEEMILFQEVFGQYRHVKGMSGIRLKGCFMLIIAKIMECYGTNEYLGSFTKSSSSHEQAGQLSSLQPVFVFIQDQLHRTIRIVELAQVAGMSEKYFIRYFKQALGVTPGQYLYQVRMNRARDLLYSHRYTVQQIAGMLGYPDPFTFSKAFKKYYKVSPSKFD